MDGILIEQVLVNLLDNAIRHAGSASPIEIDVVRRGNDVEVAVADRGPGLPVGNEAEVFDRFGRYSRGSASAGVGLGLAICRGVIEAHGGVIRGENRLGGGARFSFTLPIGSNAPRVLDEDEQSHRVIDSRGDVGSEAPGNVA
jgi:two-component system sensor histidine kinase KdpD